MEETFNLQSLQDGSLPAVGQKKPCHLRLVVSNPAPDSREKNLKAGNPSTGFRAEIQERGHPYYTLAVSDPFHCLECEVNLEIHDYYGDGGELEPETVVCHFSDIATEDLDELFGEDEMLHAMALMQFQLKILKQILLFCSSHGNALTMLVEAEDMPGGHILAVYEKLAAYKNKVPTATGAKTQMLIPATQGTFDKLADSADAINYEFQKTLWENKGFNPAIREYLKLTCCLKFSD